jgi:hypothetical protein
MDDIVIEKSPVNVMKLNADEQALLDEIEIAPVEHTKRAKAPKRPPPRAQMMMPDPTEMDFAAFTNTTKSAQAPRPSGPPEGFEEEEDEGGYEDHQDPGGGGYDEQQGGGGGEYQSNGDQPSPGYSSIDDEKADILNKLARLAKKGLQVSKRMTIYSSIQELRAELKRVMYGIEVDQSIKFSRRMLVACISGVEFLNKRYDPFDIKLEGWSESVMENLDDYDGVFEELYVKYRTKMNVAPEVKLIMMLGGSAMMFHLTNSMFKAAMPNMNDVLKQNPDLLKNMMSAVQNTQSKSAPVQSPEPVTSSGGRKEMKGPGFDIASLMGGIMMPPAPPVNSNALREDSVDDISDIISVSGDSTGGELREVKMGAGSSRKRGGGSKKQKNAISL